MWRFRLDGQDGIYVNLVSSHRFSPSVVDRFATSIYRTEAVAASRQIYSSLGTQSMLKYTEAHPDVVLIDNQLKRLREERRRRLIFQHRS
jgi:hypothetical protein